MSTQYRWTYPPIGRITFGREKKLFVLIKRIWNRQILVLKATQFDQQIAPKMELNSSSFYNQSNVNWNWMSKNLKNYSCRISKAFGHKSAIGINCQSSLFKSELDYTNPDGRNPHKQAAQSESTQAYVYNPCKRS